MQSPGRGSRNNRVLQCPGPVCGASDAGPEERPAGVSWELPSPGLGCARRGSGACSAFPGREPDPGPLGSCSPAPQLPCSRHTGSDQAPPASSGRPSAPANSQQARAGKAVLPWSEVTCWFGWLWSRPKLSAAAEPAEGKNGSDCGGFGGSGCSRGGGSGSLSSCHFGSYKKKIEEGRFGLFGGHGSDIQQQRI